MRSLSAVDEALRRWQAAGLIDEATAARLRAQEGGAGPPRCSWAAILALVFGVLLVSAGLLLFVSANWDSMSPMARYTLVLAAIAGLHLGGAFTSGAVSVALQAAGTAAVGGGVALSGQIFHLQSHWSNGTLLWLMGAVAGYALLRQWPQFAFVAVLLPAWLAGKGGEMYDWRHPLATLLVVLPAV